MTTHPSINYILNQLATDEASRERFNRLNRDFCLKKGKLVSNQFFYDPEENYLGELGIEEIEERCEFAMEKFIRTSLSRTQGKAVLSALEGEGSDYMKEGCYQFFRDKEKVDDGWKLDYSLKRIIISETLYQSFDTPLRNGESLEVALASLDAKMTELKII